MSLAGGDSFAAYAAGGAALLLYLYGLADNDIVGAASDAINAPERPIPRGEIGLGAAKVARAICLLGALLVGAFCRLPPAWWGVMAVLTAVIVLYNRVKGLWLMGLCRGVSVLAGAAAVLPARFAWSDAVGAVLVMAAGWTAYIAAVTGLSEGEERASDGLGGVRYLMGCTALVPLGVCVFAPTIEWCALPALGCLWTFVTWCATVTPLGRAHASAARRAAVGRTVGAILYLQIGFLLVAPGHQFLPVAVALWLVARLVRRLAPEISGS